MATRAHPFRVAPSQGQTAAGPGNLALIVLISLVLWAFIIAAAVAIF